MFLINFPATISWPISPPSTSGDIWQPGGFHHGSSRTWNIQIWLEDSKSADGCCMGCHNTYIERLWRHGLCFQGLLIRLWRRKKKAWNLLTPTQVPERWCRRRFDILGASHQIFHLLVVLAALTYTKGILQAFDFVHRNDHTCRLSRTAWCRLPYLRKEGITKHNLSTAVDCKDDDQLYVRQSAVPQDKWSFTQIELSLTTTCTRSWRTIKINCIKQF
jgi:Haemolysin-III related